MSEDTEQLESEELDGQSIDEMESEELEGQSADTGVDWERDYKELQSTFTKKSEELARINEFVDASGGRESIIKSMELLRDPKVQQAIESSKEKGIDEESLSPEQREALKLIDSRIKNYVDGKLGSEVTPYLEAQKERNTKALFTKMDDKYPEWREVQREMGVLAQSLAPAVVDNPTMEVMENLYFAALRNTPKYDAYLKSEYEKRLKRLKGKAVDRPSGNHAGSSGKGEFKSMDEAFAAAAREHNIEF